MLRYKLCTLLILLAMGPPLIAAAWFTALARSKYPVGMVGATILSVALLLSLARANGPEPKS